LRGAVLIFCTMSTKDEVHKIKKKLDKMVSKESDESQAMDLLKALKDLPIDFKVLSKTGIGQSVNAIRKASEDEDVQQEARQLIKDWKRLVPKDDDKKDKKERRDDDEKKEDKKDKETYPKVGGDLLDEVRQKCCQMLADALKCEELPDGIVEDPDKLAEKIEEEIFKIVKNSGPLYKNRFRSRVYNLKDKNNPTLRLNVLTGTITPAKIAAMTSEEMASDEMQKAREKFIKQTLDEAQLAIAQGTRTDLLQCGKCKKKDVTYNQMQTRSSDEPMTTFCLCNHCGNRWKFC